MQTHEITGSFLSAESRYFSIMAIPFPQRTRNLTIEWLKKMCRTTLLPVTIRFAGNADLSARKGLSIHYDKKRHLH